MHFVRHLMCGISFAGFMSSRMLLAKRVRIVTNSPSDDDTKRAGRPSSPLQSAVSLSMLGQAPSSSDAGSGGESDKNGEDGKDRKGNDRCRTDDRTLTVSKELGEDLEDIGRLFGGPTVRSFQDAIMGEQLDEKESMFMDGSFLARSLHRARMLTITQCPSSRRRTRISELGLGMQVRPLIQVEKETLMSSFQVLESRLIPLD